MAVNLQELDLSNAKKCHAARTQIEDDLAGLAAEREEILAQSTEVRFEKNASRQRFLTGKLAKVASGENDLVADYMQEAMTSLTEKIKKNMAEERHLLAEAKVISLPEKYVRPDAMGYFGKEAAKAKSDLEKLEGKSYGQNCSPGPRLRTEIVELQTVVDDWEKVEKLSCLLGQQVFEFKKEMQGFLKQREELQKSSREEALAI